MAASQQQQLSSIREPDVEGGRVLTTFLQKNGIPCALWAVSAAVHYGGGLCPLVSTSPHQNQANTVGLGRTLSKALQDIEIAINAADQPRAFDLLTSHGLTISTSSQQNHASFSEWCNGASSSSQYHDRRKTRLVTPIYELPLTGDPLDDMLRPFIIVYSAEEVGLSLIPLLSSASEDKSLTAYVPLSILNPDHASYDKELSSTQSQDIALNDSMVPSFQLLVRSEMHVLLMHAELQSPVWGQHMAQLSELVHSRSCPGGLDNLKELVADARLDDFVQWFRESLKGEADYKKMEDLRIAYREARSLKTDSGASIIHKSSPMVDSIE